MNKQLCSILWFDEISVDDILLVGGKNANLGELSQMQHSNPLQVPPGFALTTGLYRDFIASNNLSTLIAEQLDAYHKHQQSLSDTGAAIRTAILQGRFNDAQTAEISAAYQLLCDKVGCDNCDVAVRSSATAEDLPEASFAGQQESYLNIQGCEWLMNSCRSCYASLYTDRAIAYRQQQKIDERGMALSIGVQQMVRSDKACAGVMFSIDTETGFPRAVLINASWGLGESVVKGSVTPDRYMVYKPLLVDGTLCPIIEKYCGSKLHKMVYQFDEQTGEALATPVSAEDFTRTLATDSHEQQSLVLNDEEILQLANWAVSIENKYARPMDIEWAKDGNNGQLYIVQARPETIESRKDRHTLQTFKLSPHADLLLTGASVGKAIVSGKVFYMQDPQQEASFPDDGILVTERTDPDWVPVMKRASGIITDEGGTTSHAAIVSRELQVPAIVGTGNGTQLLKSGMEVTLDCASGSQGGVYRGLVDYQTNIIDLDSLPATRTDVMINLAVPDGAMRWWQLPIAGIGLARIEFIITSHIKAHPMALLHPEQVSDSDIQQQIKQLISNYADGASYFIDKLSMGIAKIAASCHPKPAIVRFSDFKTNEYRNLLGGEDFEGLENNPMLGLRGASRYYHARYQQAFELECRSIKKVREQMGFTNVIAMIPFCRTVKEADDVLAIMAECGLVRGENGLQVYMMCEIPSNVVLADLFAQRFDGFSIGSNDLTQLALGVDRDSAELQYLFDPKDEAVRRMIADVVNKAHQNKIKIGICGQAPSDHPEFAEFLVECGIDSMSLNPDSVATVISHIANAEHK
ncbi:phosphoenolpyruvate synthase [Alteromonadaceae bacterium BrNp21-10]|nr:phosphoenolpyruvate synthase [Alteromonadaceae bacterium BrNp21-10]